MRENGTDRDVALSILSALTTTGTLLASINDTLYAPHIVTQPVNYEGALNTQASFTVEATNVKAYQWQQYVPGHTDWDNSAATGNKTATLSAITVTETRLTYKYRCRLTGKDGTIIYTNEVQMVVPES